MHQPIYVVDAFAERPFTGNPAGVCPLTSEAAGEWMQQVASEMKHPETAFVRPIPGGYELRWFTPTTEVDLCGHATLATAHVLWSEGLHDASESISFSTKSGWLSATREHDAIVLDFPSEPAREVPTPDSVREILGPGLKWFGANRMDWIAELGSELELRALEPSMDEVFALGMRGLIVTARSSNAGQDFVSRFFAPQSGVPEDPVTGSAHCCLGPFWSDRLGKLELSGYQASSRGGRVGVRLKGNRVDLIGRAVTFLSGELHC